VLRFTTIAQSVIIALRFPVLAHASLLV
jgi:hypothetical protein